MRLIYAGMAFTFATFGFADTVALKNGSVINGTYLGGTARQVRIDVGDNIQTLDVSDIVRIEFTGPPAPPPPPVPRYESRPQSNVMRPEEPPPPPPRQMTQGGFTLPAGTNLTIRMIDAVDSEQNRVGQTFAASLDQ